MGKHGVRKGAKPFFLFETGPEEFTFSQLLGKLRDEYGGGFYKLQARNAHGHFKLNKTVAIEAPMIEKSEQGGMDAGTLITQFSTALAEHQSETRDLMQSMMPNINPTGSMKDTIEMMTMLMGAMNSNAPQVKTVIEQLTEFKMIKEMFGGDDSDGIGGEANLYSLLGETVKAFGGPIALALAAGAESGALNPQGIAALEAPKTTEAEKIVTTNNLEQEKEDMAMRQNIHILIKNAKLKVPPKTFADILVNSTPEDDQDKLWEFISAEKCVDVIIALEPAAAEYREWFDALREAIIKIMAEPEPDHPAEDTEVDELGKIPQGDKLTIDEQLAYDKAKELQDDPGGSTVTESITGPVADAVAGDKDKDSESSGTSDGNPPIDT